MFHPGCVCRTRQILPHALLVILCVRWPQQAEFLESGYLQPGSGLRTVPMHDKNLSTPYSASHSPTRSRFGTTSPTALSHSPGCAALQSLGGVVRVEKALPQVKEDRHVNTDGPTGHRTRSGRNQKFK